MKRIKRFFKYIFGFVNPTPSERANFLIDKIKGEGKVYTTMIQPSKPWPRAPRAEGHSPEQPSCCPDMPNIPPPPPVPKIKSIANYRGTVPQPTTDLILSIPMESLGEFNDLVRYITRLNDNWKSVKVGRFTAIHDDEWMHVEIDDI